MSMSDLDILQLLESKGEKTGPPGPAGIGIKTASRQMTIKSGSTSLTARPRLYDACRHQRGAGLPARRKGWK